MKKLFACLLVPGLLAPVDAQILCVQCFEQNDSIGINVGANDLVLNGGFENTTCALGCAGVYCPSSMQFNCSIANWTCTGGGTLTYACVYDSAQYMVVEEARAAYLGNSYANPCSGTLSGPFPNNDTSCFVQSGCEVFIQGGGYPLSGSGYGGAAGISLSQTVTGLVPGNTYVLEFWAGGEYQGWFSTPGLFAVDIGFGRTYLRCKVTQQLPDTGTRYLIQFAATSTSHAITFTNWGHVCSSCTEVVIDDVRLYEPGHLPATVPSCATPIDDEARRELIVHLGTSDDLLDIRVEGGGSSEVRVLDMLGREVLRRSFTAAASIPIDALSAGMYACIVLSDGRSFKGAFVRDRPMR